ncbi:MAG: type II toxin-antitoxin system RelE/ParE family toxin [Terriglobales bacterium]
MASASKGWQVEITRTAEKQITKLDRVVQKSILQFLRERVQTASDPRMLGKPLHGDKKDLWRYRVGDYRIVCDIQDDRVVVLVVRVGHRKGVYR